MKRNVFLLLTVLSACVLAGCSAMQYDKEGKLIKPIYTEYCDNYFGYSFCVKDVDSSGDVDFIYFTNTKETFMYREEHKETIIVTHPLHKCAMVMDDGARKASTELLHITKDTGFIVRSNLRIKLILVYTSYLPEINACNAKHKKQDKGEEENNFGGIDDDDF